MGLDILIGIQVKYPFNIIIIRVIDFPQVNGREGRGNLTMAVSPLRGLSRGKHLVHRHYIVLKLSVFLSEFWSKR